MAECLESFAHLAAATADPEQATRLLAAAQALRRALGAPLLPLARQEQEAELARLRTLLGEDRFATAWQSGSSATWEQAVAAALGETG